MHCNSGPERSTVPSQGRVPLYVFFIKIFILGVISEKIYEKEERDLFTKGPYTALTLSTLYCGLLAENNATLPLQGLELVTLSRFEPIAYSLRREWRPLERTEV